MVEAEPDTHQKSPSPVVLPSPIATPSPIASPTLVTDPSPIPDANPSSHTLCNSPQDEAEEKESKREDNVFRPQRKLDFISSLSSIHVSLQPS
eukprot:TRINITY_DN5416_c0_g1_i1.p2 TRINITY_DN5416_c0_g1~~TRINITY_DN5416_c0_g1_i1.p2  ORF type:complete len:93 (-),score=15.55 TRINITY_DN5416_c0_g1_i1:54-332(-)